MTNFSLSYSSGAFVLQNFGSNKYADSCCQLRCSFQQDLISYLPTCADFPLYNMNVTFTCSFSSSDSTCSLGDTGSQIVPLLACNLDEFTSTKPGGELRAAAIRRRENK